jgi:hypothetical protein
MWRNRHFDWSRSKKSRDAESSHDRRVQFAESGACEYKFRGEVNIDQAVALSCSGIVFGYRVRVSCSGSISPEY